MDSIKIYFLLSQEGQRRLFARGDGAEQRQIRVLERGDGGYGAEALSLADFDIYGEAVVMVGHAGWCEETGPEPGPAGVFMHDDPDIPTAEMLEAEVRRRRGAEAMAAVERKRREEANAARQAKAREARRARTEEALHGASRKLADLRELGVDVGDLADRVQSMMRGDAGGADLAVVGEVEALLSSTIASRQAEAREAWIAEHGSDRLKQCVAEGFEYGEIYIEERIAAERPEWSRMRNTGRSTLAAPANPPAGALEVLGVARRSAPDAKLVRVIGRHAGAVEHVRGVAWGPKPPCGYVCTCDLGGETLVFGTAWVEVGKGATGSNRPAKALDLL